MFIINFCLNMFWASLCPSSEEQRPYYCIWCVVLVLLDVVGYTAVTVLQYFAHQRECRYYRGFRKYNAPGFVLNMCAVPTMHFVLYTQSQYTPTMHFALYTQSQYTPTMHFALYTQSQYTPTMHFALHNQSQYTSTTHFALDTHNAIGFVLN